MASIRNPYLRSSSGVQPDAAIRSLLRNSSNGLVVSLSTIQALRDELRHCREWSTETTLEFGSMVQTCLASSHGDDSRHSVLGLLATALENWQDHVVYAVVVQDTNTNSLFNLLTKLAIDPRQNKRLRQSATICLATTWRCLRRLDNCTSLDNKGAPWWMPDERCTNSLVIWSLKCLDNLYGSEQCRDDFCLQTQEIENVDRDQFKVASLSILSILLRHRVFDLSVAQEKLSQYTSKLLKELQVLNHSVLSPSSSEYTLPIAMLSMSVVCFLQNYSLEQDALFHGLDQTIQSTGLVENLVRFVFSSSDHGPPRWTAATSNRFRQGYLQSFGLELFSHWRICNAAAWKVLVATLEPKLPGLVDAFWSALIDNQSPNATCNLEGQLPRIIWLHLNMRSHARFRLSMLLEKMLGNGNNAVTQNETPPHKIIHSLFRGLRTCSGTSYSSRLMVARLLRILLSDRRTVSSNDDLSRSLWEAIDESIVEGHFQVVLEHACTNDVDQPLLLVLVDTMEILLEQNNCCFIETLGAHNLESLIYLVKPKTIRFDFEEEQADTDTETPPLHNLSRMDETSICIEHEETKSPKGLDHSVRLSVATSLAHLASVAPPNESIGLLVSRISTVVNDFLSEYHASIEQGATSQDKIIPSLDQIQRFIRFQNCIATPETEGFLSTLLFTSLSLRRQTTLRQVQAQTETQQKLETTLQREQKAQAENTRLKQQLRKQSILFQREMSHANTNLTQDSRQLVAMHAAERSKTEEHSKTLQQQTKEATSELKRVRAELQASQNELQTTQSQVKSLHGTIGTLQQQVHDEMAKAEEILKNAHSDRETIQSLQQKCDNLQNVMEERENRISSVEDTNHNLQYNLEDLFADMCSLAQIYQHQEATEESQKAQHQEALDSVKQKLVSERKSNQALSSQMDELQQENEKLYRKLGKYKERLEEERNARKQDRQKEEEHRRKRNGPVSYLNSLHNSTSVDNSNDRSRSSRDERPPKTRDRSAYEHSSSKSRSAYEKENSYRSGTSQRRTKY